MFSAKDLATGKEQHITITSSTNMRQGGCREGSSGREKFAAEDKKRREEVDKKNEAENLCYSVEKLISESGDKMEEADKTDLNAKVSALKDAISKNDLEAMKTAARNRRRPCMQFLKSRIRKPRRRGQPRRCYRRVRHRGGDTADNAHDVEYKDVDDDKK